MKRAFFILLLLIASGNSLAYTIFCPKSITAVANFGKGGETKTWTLTDDWWKANIGSGSSTIHLVTQTTLDGYSFGVMWEPYYNDIQSYTASGAGCYASPIKNNSATTLTASGSSYYPAGRTLNMTYTDRCNCSISSGGSWGATIDGNTISGGTTAFPAFVNPTITVVDSSDWEYYIQEVGGDFRRILTGSTSFSGAFIGHYRIGRKYIGESFPSWFVNDIVGDGTQPCYGDFLESGEYADNPQPILYQFPYIALPTNIQCNTEWAFVQSELGDSTYPMAYINDEVKCAAHSTTHIIDYNILSTDNWSYDSTTHEWQIDFTMSITLGTHNYGTDENPDIRTASGGNCVFKVWDVKYGTNYDDCPSNKRASYGGTDSSVPKFRYKINKWTGARSLVFLSAQ